ncbi:MAG: alpha/beta hydrolase [Candidatus Omnitrophica bacterium]|nr:alpha/beta hydrolase [Candidatus Omnitrophota bacterium]
MFPINSKTLIWTVVIMAVIVLTGCASIETQAVRERFIKQTLYAPPFYLTAYHKLSGSSDTLVVYIEGDGYAWVSRIVPSDDPTPRHPLAFFLATQDKSPNVLYLARPGQFLAAGAPAVDQAYWTSKRYSEEVIQSMNSAINEIKRSSGANKISLIGYSGGAAVAVLVAALRNDVTALRTVAGNLAPDVFSQEHHLSQLFGSLNPVTVAPTINAIPQRHFVGQKDRIVTKQVTEAFLDAEGDDSRQTMTEVYGADHTHGWKEHWQKLLLIPLHSN